MGRHEITVDVLGSWSLATSRVFWEVFAPAALNPPDRYGWAGHRVPG